MKVEKRKLAVVVDALIYRREALEDALPFTINVLETKSRIRELNNLIEAYRSLRDEQIK